MAKIEKSILVKAPAEKIWSIVNWERVPEYYESIKRIEWTSEPVMKKGTTVRVFQEVMGKKEQFDTVITEWVPNEKVIWKITSGNMAGIYTATLKPSSDGYLLTTLFDYDLPYSVFGKLLDKLRVQKLMEIESLKAVEKIKAIAESP